MNQALKLFGKSKTDKRVREALKQHPLMTDEPRWQIDDIKTGEHFAGDKKRAFLDKFIEVLKRG